MEFHRAKIMAQSGEDEGKILVHEGFHNVGVDGSNSRRPLLVFEEFGSQEIRWIVDFVRIDNKTFGYKDPPQYEEEEANEDNVGRKIVNADCYTFLRFEEQEGFDSIWASLQDFVGDYMLDSNSEEHRQNEFYPQEMLSWPKEFVSWDQRYQNVRSLCELLGSELPTLVEYDAVERCVNQCHLSINPWGWNLNIPDNVQNAYDAFRDLILWDKARLAGNWVGERALLPRRPMDEVVGLFNGIMESFIELMTKGDI